MAEHVCLNQKSGSLRYYLSLITVYAKTLTYIDSFQRIEDHRIVQIDLKKDIWPITGGVEFSNILQKGRKVQDGQKDRQIQIHRTVLATAIYQFIISSKFESILERKVAPVNHDFY